MLCLRESCAQVRGGRSEESSSAEREREKSSESLREASGQPVWCGGGRSAR